MCTDFSSNLQNRHSFIQTILMRGTNPVLTWKLHMSGIWSKSKKWNMLLNFWVNIGIWPVISMWLAMADATVMSEYTIYMVQKLIAMFCPITCVMFIWKFWKLVVTGYLNNADIHVQMKFWKFENCTFCEITSSNVLGFFFKPSEQMLLDPDNSNEGKNPMLTSKLHMSEIWSESKVEYLT